MQCLKKIMGNKSQYQLIAHYQWMCQKTGKPILNPRTFTICSGSYWTMRWKLFWINFWAEPAWKMSWRLEIHAVKYGLIKIPTTASYINSTYPR